MDDPVENHINKLYKYTTGGIGLLVGIVILLIVVMSVASVMVHRQWHGLNKANSGSSGGSEGSGGTNIIL